jgi:hypothetical protein
MILDQGDEFTTAGGEAFTAAALGTGAVFDGGKALDWGAGEPLYPYVRVTHDADFNPTTSATFEFIAADNALLTTNPVTLSTKTVLVAALTKDTLHQCPPLLSGSNKQYLGFKVTPNGGNATTGKLIAGLVDKNGRPQNINYL